MTRLWRFQSSWLTTKMLGPQLLPKQGLRIQEYRRLYTIMAYLRDADTIVLIFDEPLLRPDELVCNLGGANIVAWFSVNERDDRDYIMRHVEIRRLVDIPGPITIEVPPAGWY